MKKIILILLFVFLYSDNLYDIYRYEGIDKVQQIIEKSIQSPSFWLKRLKNIDVSFGYFEDKKNILFCDKLDRTLSVFYVDKGKFKFVKLFHVIVGKLGNKKKRGRFKNSKRSI